MDRLVTPEGRGTSLSWGLPPPCEQLTGPKVHELFKVESVYFYSYDDIVPNRSLAF